MLQTIALGEVILCWAAWSSAFLMARRRSQGQKKVVRAPASMLGLILQMVGFALAWVYLRPASFEKSPASLIASMLIGPPSAALAWTATRHLGKQWRFEAALNEDHELVQSGPYRRVRHPIYLSMLGMLVATGFAQAWWPMFGASLVAFLIGTEIRVREEDRLLAERFGARFTDYRARVRAYLPLLR